MGRRVVVAEVAHCVRMKEAAGEIVEQVAAHRTVAGTPVEHNLGDSSEQTEELPAEEAA